VLVLCVFVCVCLSMLCLGVICCGFVVCIPARKSVLVIEQLDDRNKDIQESLSQTGLILVLSCAHSKSDIVPIVG